MRKTNFLILLLFLATSKLFGQFEKVTNSEIVFEELRSSRAVWGDFNNNSFPDIYIKNSDSTNSLFINNGDETFTKILTGNIATDEISTSTVSKVDLNNDGFLDLFVSGGSSYNNLYLGNGDGTFTKSSTADIVTKGGTSVSWGDYDRDGDLDAALSNFSGNNAFFENNGDGSFTEVFSSVFSTVGSTYSSWIDINNDGFLDIYTISFVGSSNLFINNGDKTFTKDSENIIVMDVSDAKNQAWGDYNNDGYLDLFTGNYPPQRNQLFQNNGDGSFTEIENSELIITDTSEYVEGSNWADYDNDGFLDLYMATSTKRSRLFHNNGDGTFTEIIEDFLANTNTAYRYSANWADYNNDGFLDLFSAVADLQIESSSDDRNILLKNLCKINNWLNISLRGSENNFFGVGAKITAFNGTLLSSKRIIENGFGVSDFRENFGIGESFGLDSLIVSWPTGNLQVLKNILSNKFLEIHEDSIYSIPMAPSNQSATALDDQGIKLDWEDENMVNEGFLLFLSTDSITYDLIDTLTSSTTSTTIENLEEGTKYYFNLLSISKSNYSDNNFTSAITQLSAPTDISQSILTSESVQINWADNSELEDSYVVELDISQDFTSPQIFSSNSAGLLLENLSPETDYFVRVKAINEQTVSDYSEILSFNTTVVLSLEDLIARNIEIFPNPTDDYLNIRNLSEQSLSFTLRSLRGSLILSKEINRFDESISINLKSLSSGTYIVTLSNKNQNTVSRVIKR